MNKALTKLLFVCFFIFSFNCHAWCITHKQLQIASISTGTITGLCVAAATLYGSYKLNCDKKTDIKAATAGGISSTLLTYFLMMKLLEKYTPEHILQTVEHDFKNITQDELANKTFTHEKELLEYLNYMFGNSFAMEESIAHLKNLNSQTTEIIEQLNQIQYGNKNCAIINTCEKLKDNILLFKGFISTKITQITIAFIKTDTNINLTVLDEQLKILGNAQKIISETISQIPHKKIFNNVMMELKTQNDEVSDLKNLINIKKIQITIQDSDDILKNLSAKAVTSQTHQLESLLINLEQTQDQLKTMPHSLSDITSTKLINLQTNAKLKLIESLIKLVEIDYFVSTEFKTSEDLGNTIATKFESSWYLILAKKNLAELQCTLEYISDNFVDVTKFIKENPTPMQFEELFNTLQEKNSHLIKKVDLLMLMIVKNKDYPGQLQAYEQSLLTKQQITILENQRILMENHLDNDKKLEASINKLKQSQGSKLQEVKCSIDKLENKIKDYNWKIESLINQLKNEVINKLNGRNISVT